MPELSRYDPTAMQDPEGHDTLASIGYVPRGLGVGCTVQLDPSQTSARVGAPMVSTDPTAVQLLAEAHVTPHKWPLTAAGWTDHAVPFHDSMRPPTAVQEVAVGHDTLLRLLSWLGLGESASGSPLQPHNSSRQPCGLRSRRVRPRRRAPACFVRPACARDVQGQASRRDFLTGQARPHMVGTELAHTTRIGDRTAVAARLRHDAVADAGEEIVFVVRAADQAPGQHVVVVGVHRRHVGFEAEPDR